jgi:hypothetical protein
MRFDGLLAVGAKGGHGPIRYTVQSYEPGKRVVFQFTAPAGFDGTHRFVVDPSDEGSELRHVIDMRIGGQARFSWPTVFRPLHDALLEDALDKVEAVLEGGEWVFGDLSWRVRLLRRLLAGRARRKK